MMGKRQSADKYPCICRESETQRAAAELDLKSINFDLIYELNEAVNQ